MNMNYIYFLITFQLVHHGSFHQFLLFISRFCYHVQQKWESEVWCFHESQRKHQTLKFVYTVRCKI